MGMAAILATWSGTFEQTFIPPSHWGSTWNMALIGPVVSEKMFEECEQRMLMDGRRTPAYTISSPMSLKALVS